MRLEDIKVGLYSLQALNISTYFGHDISNKSIYSNYIGLYENNGYLVGSRSSNMYYNFNYDLVKRNGIYYLRSTIIPVLTINDELKEYLLKNKQRKENEIVFGYFPSNFSSYVSENHSETGKYIHIPSRNKKYQIYESSDNRIYFVTSDNSYPTSVYLYPMVWRLDETKNELILNNAILDTFPLYKGLVKQKNIKFDSTLLYKYLTTDFLNDIFQFEDVFDRSDEKTEDDQMKDNEVQREINNIRSLIPNDINRLVFTQRLNGLIDNYNKDLNDYVESIDKTLVFGVKDDKFSSMVIKKDLEQLKKEINEYKDGAQVYEDLLKYINTIESTIINCNTYDPDEFQLLVLDLMNGPLKYLNDSKYVNLIKTELCDKPRNLIVNHMKQLLSSNLITEIPFKNKEELTYYLRQILHPILISIANDVKTKSAEERKKIQINKSKELREKAYSDYYRDMKILLLESLNEAYNETEELLMKYGIDTSEIYKIYTKPIDYTKDGEIVNREILDKYKDLKSIYTDVSYQDELKDSVIRKIVK